MIKLISTEHAPQAIGPYSQGVQCGDFVYLSGQIPLDPQTNTVIGKDIALQTRQVLLNIQAILAEANLTLRQVVKTTVFIRDMNQFTLVNEIYAEFFGEHRPARSTVEVSRLPKDVLIEIEVVAFRS